MKLYKIKRSKIDKKGRGLYATRDIKKGTKIIGISNVMNKLPLTASNLYAKNLFSFVRNLYSKEKKQFVINLEDEIIKNTLLKE